MICSAVQEFFTTGVMPSYVSATKLVVLPKVNSPQTASEFRPISYCNAIYKCTSKLLCQRIKEILPSLMNQCQEAFVKGRELLYNMLICQDIARGYRRQHISPRCILKIDLQKTFDSIHWEFLKGMLVALKFPLPFIKWVMACVTSVRLSIHLNGRGSGTFEKGKELRQEDPLSPFLFVISMEYLSRLMNVVSMKPGFKFHPNCKNLGLTHLMFADDLIMFCKVDKPQI